MQLRFAGAIAVAACAAEPASRDQRVIDALADDNYVLAQRDPALVAMKLRKMQRGPYERLRGTALVYWRDAMEPGPGRAPIAFGDPGASRVLLVGDPHPENVGTFRAGDGAMLIDWNDFDASGYGPFTGDLRRLAAGLAIAAADDTIAGELARCAATGYATQIAALVAGEAPRPVAAGAHPLLDGELAKARKRGDARFALDELAPVTGGARALALGDLEAIGADGVIEDRVVAVDAETASWLDAAVARWRVKRLDEASAAVKLRARRIGSGVSSYAVARYQVVLEGPTASPDDDRVIELKETRDGVVIRGVPQRESAEWATPALRAVDTQRRLQLRPDADLLLGAAQAGGLSLKVRDREAYQRGLDHADLAQLAAGGDAERDQLRALAELLGGLLARAHGMARTADGELGWTAIAPLLAGREAQLADELEPAALADAATTVADHALLKDRDLAAAIGAPR